MKVALVGTCPSSRMLAPYSDPSWEIWSCSPDNAFGRLPRVNAWFEIHGDLLWPESAEWGAPQYLKWLNEQPFCVYAIDQAALPKATALPRDDLVRTFGAYFFTSTFAWAFAMALRKGAKAIGLYGIDMSVSGEYAHQRPGLQHFMWLAAQTGVRVVAPDESDILQPPPLYGVSDMSPMGRKLAIRERELRGRADAMRKKRDQYAHDIAFLEGALEDIDYQRKTWIGNNQSSDGEIIDLSTMSSNEIKLYVKSEGKESE